MSDSESTSSSVASQPRSTPDQPEEEDVLTEQQRQQQLRALVMKYTSRLVADPDCKNFKMQDLFGLVSTLATSKIICDHREGEDESLLVGLQSDNLYNYDLYDVIKSLLGDLSRGTNNDVDQQCQSSAGISLGERRLRNLSLWRLGIRFKYRLGDDIGLLDGLRHLSLYGCLALPADFGKLWRLTSLNVSNYSNASHAVLRFPDVVFPHLIWLRIGKTCHEESTGIWIMKNTPALQELKLFEIPDSDSPGEFDVTTLFESMAEYTHAESEMRCHLNLKKIFVTGSFETQVLTQVFISLFVHAIPGLPELEVIDCDATCTLDLPMIASALLHRRRYPSKLRAIYTGEGFRENFNTESNFAALVGILQHFPMLHDLQLSSYSGCDVFYIPPEAETLLKQNYVRSSLSRLEPLLSRPVQKLSRWPKVLAVADNFGKNEDSTALFEMLRKGTARLFIERQEFLEAAQMCEKDSDDNEGEPEGKQTRKRSKRRRYG